MWGGDALLGCIRGLCAGILRNPMGIPRDPWNPIGIQWDSFRIPMDPRPSPLRIPKLCTPLPAPTLLIPPYGRGAPNQNGTDGSIVGERIQPHHRGPRNGRDDKGVGDNKGGRWHYIKGVIAPPPLYPHAPSFPHTLYASPFVRPPLSMPLSTPTL